jgi:hypothetical protein
METNTISAKRKSLGEKMKSDSTVLHLAKKQKEHQEQWLSKPIKSDDPFKELITYKKSLQADLQQKQEELIRKLEDEMQRRMSEEFERKLKEVCDKVPFSNVSIFDKSEVDDSITKWPKEWEIQQNNCELKPVTRDSEEWKTVEQRMKESMPSVNILQIDRSYIRYLLILI